MFIVNPSSIDATKRRIQSTWIELGETRNSKMGYLDNKFESQVELHLASAKRKLGALGRHVVTSHQVLLALAFLYWWGTTSGFIAKTVMLLLGLDFLECWLTTEEKIEFKKDWKVKYEKR